MKYLILIIFVTLTSCASKPVDTVKVETLSPPQTLLKELRTRHQKQIVNDLVMRDSTINVVFASTDLGSPDQFKKEINKSLNLMPTKSQTQFDNSLNTKFIDVAMYVWETPQFKIEMDANVRMSTDSVFVRLWVND
jgi:hypothetical protein